MCTALAGAGQPCAYTDTKSGSTKRASVRTSSGARPSRRPGPARGRGSGSRGRAGTAVKPRPARRSRSVMVQAPAGAGTGRTPSSYSLTCPVTVRSRNRSLVSRLWFRASNWQRSTRTCAGGGMSASGPGQVQASHIVVLLCADGRRSLKAEAVICSTHPGGLPRHPDAHAGWLALGSPGPEPRHDGLRGATLHT
ncbi:Eukaryotic translation initiation factor 2A [Frankliniella fusca]|uniref:Eukaryotic translation initiation factor 2A n=1 Tax=Frankliniella fusca TaxID=407009 RepID=A0AAE1LH94_9NEOP|nr:Eukaryotic translation initiation factor 2A [Frankliniella fusca]